MTYTDDVPAKLTPYLDVIGSAVRLKLCHELGRHRLARRSLDTLTEQIACLRVQVHTLAAAQVDDDEDASLDELLAERWPPGSLPDPLGPMLEDGGCDR